MSDESSRGKKREITEEEIKRYINQGYYFRVKESNGKKYITRRKGREERSLGRYTEKAWSMILRVQNQKDDAVKPVETTIEKPDKKAFHDILDKMEQIKEEISISKGLIMFANCLHNIEGNCTYWHWETKPRFFESMDELDIVPQTSYKLTDIVHEGRIEKRWTVKAKVLFCMNCPTYISEKDIAFVEAFKLLQGK